MCDGWGGGGEGESIPQYTETGVFSPSNITEILLLKMQCPVGTGQSSY
jgi:hypothetical protein